jgi:hypothetical protein
MNSPAPEPLKRRHSRFRTDGCLNGGTKRAVDTSFNRIAATLAGSAADGAFIEFSKRVVLADVLKSLQGDIDIEILRCQCLGVGDGTSFKFRLRLNPGGNAQALL